MKKAEAHVQLKPGIIGVRVKIMPPDAYFPDRIKILDVAPPEETVVAAEQAPPAETQAAAVQTEQETEDAEEPTVQAKEVQDKPKSEEAKQ
jgi:small subunit ribosomal protein S3